MENKISEVVVGTSAQLAVKNLEDPKDREPYFLSSGTYRIRLVGDYYVFEGTDKQFPGISLGLTPEALKRQLKEMKN
jgi:hypothetical protein